MNTNFHFLKNEWPTFFDRASRAEGFVRTDPRASLSYARMALEVAVNWMYRNDEEMEMPYDDNISALMVNSDFKDQFNYKMLNELHLIRKTGNLAIHNKAVSDVDSCTIIENLYYFGKWFAKSYRKEEIDVPGPFDWDLIPEKNTESISKRQLEALQKEMDEKLARFQAEQKKQQEEREKLLAENELYRRQIEERTKVTAAQKVEANHEDDVQHPRDEAQTRKYFIDVSLREAGWDLDGANDKEFKVEFMPKSTNPSTTGKIDYVLWDDDGTPLALVEAKKTMESASKGENQAQLYAESLVKMGFRRPVMYYTNGFNTFLWDDQFYKKARPVHGFYTKAELQTLMFRRENRKDIRKAEIDIDIAGRPYQMRAIKSIAEHFAGTDKRTGKLIGTNRGALLVLATGTGKTRTSIAFSKIMMESNWAKRILFLADRVSLVKQAKSNFVKLLPEHASVNLIEEKDNPDARIAFSTYQTMMGLIDKSRDGDSRFYGVGHFDLIIIDEAHRSIYQKYFAVFEYFDALLLGLTATPKDSIDKNTFSIFDLPDKTPTDAYDFDEAVKEKHLVPYHTIDLPTKFHTDGIRYDDLSDEEKEAFENEILDGGEATGNEWIKPTELNDWLFNKDTAIKVLKHILENGIKNRGGEELGKTIIFAKNQKHAHFLKDVLLDMDKEQFSNDYVKVITHSEPKSQEFIERFCDEEKDRLPQIAISVDMMDTGIDAPSCVNLVFYKPVRSKEKFWQMIGRGSRLRPDLFGPGKDKTHYLIFDLFENFEFFKINPKGIESSSQISLTAQVFILKLQLANYLASDGLKKDEELQGFRKILLDELHHEIASLEEERFDVKMRLETVLKYGINKRAKWNNLSKREIQTIEQDLATLVQPPKGDSDLARYYDKRLYLLMLKRLETPDSDLFKNHFKIPISKVITLSIKLERKVSIPIVKENLALIQEPLEEVFWEQAGIAHLEKIRSGIRDLLKYIDREDERYVMTDYEDILGEITVNGNPRAAEEGTEYVNPFASTAKRLEQLINENKDNITISRIRNGEKITQEELTSLEDILFSDKVQKEKLIEEVGEGFNLVSFIISLMGISKEKVDQAFAVFINKYQLDSKQIKFLETIKIFLTTNGKLDPKKLFEAPFRSFHIHGVNGVFNDEQADDLFRIVGKMNEIG